MYRQNNRRHASREVRMVRMAPHDRRTAVRRKRDMKRAAVMLLTFVSLSAEENGEKMPQEILGEPEAVNTGDLVRLAEESEPTIPLIAIDAGHGGEDDGCCREDVHESRINMELAERLSAKLQSMGFETLLIRANHETKMSLEERVEKAEKAGAAKNRKKPSAASKPGITENEREADVWRSWYTMEPWRRQALSTGMCEIPMSCM